MRHIIVMFTTLAILTVAATTAAPTASAQASGTDGIIIDAS